MRDESQDGAPSGESLVPNWDEEGAGGGESPHLPRFGSLALTMHWGWADAAISRIRNRANTWWSGTART